MRTPGSDPFRDIVEDFHRFPKTDFLPGPKSQSPPSDVFGFGQSESAGVKELDDINTAQLDQLAVPCSFGSFERSSVISPGQKALRKFLEAEVLLARCPPVEIRLLRLRCEMSAHLLR